MWHGSSPSLDSVSACSSHKPGRRKQKRGDHFECDYKKNCTRLYKKIEERDWEAVCDFLDRGSWPDSKSPDKLSPKKQTMTWVTRYDPKDTSTVLWSELPLHLAIVFKAPFSVVRRLIDLYPQSLRIAEGDRKLLPIHLALRTNAADILSYMLIKFPASVNAEDADGHKVMESLITAYQPTETERDQEVEKLKLQLESKNQALRSALSKFSVLSVVSNDLQQMESIKEMGEPSIEVSTATFEETKQTFEADRAGEEIESACKESKRTAEASKISFKGAQVAVQKTDTEALFGKTWDEWEESELEDLHSLKLLDEIVFHDKRSLLERQSTTESMQEDARDDEESLRRELASVSRTIAASFSVDEISQIKQEIQAFKNCRLEQESQDVTTRIDALLGLLEVDSESDYDEGTSSKRYLI